MLLFCFFLKCKNQLDLFTTTSVFKSPKHPLIFLFVQALDDKDHLLLQKMPGLSVTLSFPSVIFCVDSSICLFFGSFFQVEITFIKLT